ncbi:VWA domain-containing protein [Corynebacterium callunae]|uniref:VWA domain-containing protein n=1 Tax=Corynebacterium callunae TaxID=1721 RepID=UPI003981DFC2
MARHSSGQSNFRLSKSLTIAVIALVAIIALIIAWALNRSDDTSTQAEDQATECIAGDLTLPIGGDDSAVSEAVAAFNSNSPTTRDFCVTAEAVAGDQAAATYLFAGSRSDAASALAETGAVASSAESSWPQVGSAQAGVAVAEGTDASTLTVDQVSLPVATDSATAAAVALALADSEEAAAQALAANQDTTMTAAESAPAFATIEGAELPAGYTFSPIEGAEVPVWAIATNATSGISEDQARAGADFASYDFETGAADPTALETVLAAAANAAPTETAAPVAPVEAAQTPSDTIINLDTSANMDRVVADAQESYHTVITRILADLARETGAMGNQVALNNFSSPLNPGVTKGWRANVSFPDQSAGENAAGAVVRLGTGGVPLTRAAVVAATQIAKEGSPNGQPMRVVIITSGSAGEYQDASFLADLQAASAPNISLHVVHVGPDAVDTVLQNFALNNSGTATSASTSAEITAALRAAFGL